MMRTATRKRGQTIVEFGIIVSILMMLTIGAVQYGLIAAGSNATKQVARRLARVGAVKGNNSGFDLAGYTNWYSRQVGLNPTDVTSTASCVGGNLATTTSGGTCNTLSANGSGTLTVTVTYNMSKRIFLPFFPGTSGLKHNYTASFTAYME